ncbi:hypothetical protein AB924_08020 [Listeria monocytogenes]|nr:hypothetical protein [Listeria monocytogenes]EAG7074005.1 hypothetical protein [Listeria monocytogenes]EIL9238525.1 hypothetical protein [Listeria monocytogenes]
MNLNIKRTGIRMPDYLDKEIQLISKFEAIPKNHFMVRELRKAVNLYKENNPDFIEWLEKKKQDSNT